MHSVVQTLDFRADVKDAGIGKEELDEIVNHVSANPCAGPMIKSTGGARKVHFAGRGKGKRGGYRVITYFGGEDIPVCLLNIFSKGDRVDLSQAERNKLMGLAEDYRQGVNL